MDTNDSNIKPQSTGGLKLMTVFVVVLALHVAVILGMTTYYLMRSSPDADMLTDQTHKSVKAAPDGVLTLDGQMPDAPDKSATASTTSSTDANGSSSAPAPATTPATDTTASASTAATATPTDTSSTATTPSASTTSTATAEPVSSTLTPPADTTTIVSTSSPTPIPFRTDSAAITPSATPASTTPATAVTEPVTPPVAASAPITDGAPYVVKSHDSLARIAHLNHTSVAKLKTANSLTSDRLRIGQKLVIPASTVVAATGPTTPATTPDATATATSPATSASATAALAPASATTPTAKVKMAKNAASGQPALNHHLYTVVKGDTLTKIAHKFKTTSTALIAANNITDPAKLSIGKKLKIPSKEARSAKNSEPAGVTPAQVQAKSTAAPSQLANITP